MTTKVAELAVDITVNGSQQAQAALSGVEKGGKGATSSLASVSAGALAAGVSFAALAAGATKFLSAAEEYKRIASRLNVVSESTKAAADVQERLYRVAQSTGVQFESLVQTYSRIALSAKALNATQAQMVQVTANVSKALRVSGASAQEAASASLQLAQALGSGKLAGDELKSILENAPVLAQQIAAGLGVGVGELKSMGAAGRLLSEDILRAILSRTNAIDTAFAKVGDTMESSGTRLSNAMGKALASIDQKIGASRMLTAFFNTTAKNIDERGLLLGGLQSIFGSQTLTRDDSRSKTKTGVQGTLPTITVSGSRRTRTTQSGRSASRPSGITSKDRFLSRNPDKSDVSPGRTPLSGVSEGTSGASLVESSIVAEFGALQDRMSTLGEGIGSTLINSISTGISTAVQSGSFGEGFRALTGSLLGGLGRMAIEFGTQSLLISQYMLALKNSLGAFAGVPGIVASLGLIAVGSVMVGLGQKAARSSFSGAGRSDGFSGGGFTIPTSVSSSSVFGAPSSIIADGRTPISSSAAGVNAVTPMVFNVFSPDDPTTQRFIMETTRKAQGRGSF